MLPAVFLAAIALAGDPVTVINDQTHVELHSPTSATIRKVYQVLISDQRGRQEAIYTTYYDAFRTVKSFTAELAAPDGKVLRRVPMGRMLDYSYVDNSSLISDTRVKYVDLDPARYPVVCTFAVEYELRDAFELGEISRMAVEGPVTRRSLQVTVPDTSWLRIRAFNGGVPAIRTGKPGKHVIKWEVQDLKKTDFPAFAVQPEAWIPAVKVLPAKLKQGSFEGSWDTWATFGDFIDRLNKGRDALPPEESARIKQLVQGETSIPKIVEILYADLKSTTRYLNISLGIGGNQSMTAAEVCRTKFGDCKGLTTYLKGMLSAVGIPSHYVMVMRSERRDSLFLENPSYQFNHVILGIPAGMDTIWVESTSQTLPAGYLDRTTSNRYALWLDGPRSHPVRTMVLRAESNAGIKRARVTLNSSGNISGTVEEQYTGVQHEFIRHLVGTNDSKAIEQFIKDRFSTGTVQLSGVQAAAPAETAAGTLTYRIQSPSMVAKTGNLLILKSNLFETSMPAPASSDTRTSDFRLPWPFFDVDSITVKLPPGLNVDALPEDMSASFAGGQFKRTMRIEGDSLLHIYRELRMPMRLVKESQFAAFNQFLRTAQTADRQSVVLVGK